LPHVQGQTGAPPTAGEQQKDKAKLAGDDDAKANGHVETQPVEGLAAKGATAAERAPTPGVPLLPPTPADRVIDASWVVMVRLPRHPHLTTRSLPEAVRSALLLLSRRGVAARPCSAAVGLAWLQGNASACSVVWRMFDLHFVHFFRLTRQAVC
jgi:hypothetical protein